MTVTILCIVSAMRVRGSYPAYMERLNTQKENYPQDTASRRRPARAMHAKDEAGRRVTKKREGSGTEHVEFVVNDLSDHTLRFIEEVLPKHAAHGLPIPAKTLDALCDAGFTYRFVENASTPHIILAGMTEQGPYESVPYSHNDVIRLLKAVARKQRGKELYMKLNSLGGAQTESDVSASQMVALAGVSRDTGDLQIVESDQSPPHATDSDEDLHNALPGLTLHIEENSMVGKKGFEGIVSNTHEHTHDAQQKNVDLHDIDIEDVLEATLRGNADKSPNPAEVTEEDVFNATLRGAEPTDTTLEDVLEAVLRNDEESTSKSNPEASHENIEDRRVDAEPVESTDPRFASRGLGAGEVEDAKILSETAHPGAGMEQEEHVEVLDTKASSPETASEEGKVEGAGGAPQVERTQQSSVGGEKTAATPKNATEKEGEGKKEQKNNFFDTRFEKEFGLSSIELRSIEGFARLSPAAQKMVFENLKEYAEQGSDSFLGSVWSGIKEKITGKEGAGVLRKGSRGMAAYGDVVKTLVWSANTYGPKVHEVDGKPVADFVAMEFDRAHRKEQKEATDALNAAAHALARTPASWQEGGVVVHTDGEWKITSFLKERFMGGDAKHRAERATYDERRSAYEDAKREFAATLEAQGYAKSEIVRKLIEIDGTVHRVRSIETDPVAQKALVQFGKSEKGLLSRIGAHWATGAGVSAGFGAVSRYALGQVMGFLGAPTFAAAMGGVRGWNRAEAELRERDRQARMGTKDTSDEALNIVDASRVVEVGGQKRDVGLTAKLEALMTEFNDVQSKVYEVLEKGDKETFTHLVATEYTPLLERLNARATYTHDKLMENRIQFGDARSHVAQQARLLEVLGTAKALVAEASLPEESRIATRLGRYMEYREGAIAARRWNKQVRDASMGAVKGAGFALAGALAVEYFKDDIDTFGKKLFNGATDKLHDWFGGAVPTGTSDSVGEVPVMSDDWLNSPMPSGAPESVKDVYTITRGDTMTALIKEHVPHIKGMQPGQAQENAIANILKSLTPEEMDRIGITSHNVDKIIAGKTLDLAELGKIVEGKKVFIDHAMERFGDTAAFHVGEDVGDFKGGAYELSSDALNADRTIRETVTEIDSMPESDEIPHPDAGVDSDVDDSASVAPEVVHDPLLEKKVAIMEKYVTHTAFTQTEWSAIEKGDAYVILRDHTRGMQQTRLEERIATALQLFKQPPYGLVPEPKESVASFMKRALTYVVEKGDDAQFSSKLSTALRDTDVLRRYK